MKGRSGVLLGGGWVEGWREGVEDLGWRGKGRIGVGRARGGGRVRHGRRRIGLRKRRERSFSLHRVLHVATSEQILKSPREGFLVLDSESGRIRGRGGRGVLTSRMRMELRRARGRGEAGRLAAVVGSVVFHRDTSSRGFERWHNINEEGLQRCWGSGERSTISNRNRRLRDLARRTNEPIFSSKSFIRPLRDTGASSYVH